MATSGKVPTLGFLGRIKNLVWLGFGAGAGDDTTIADAYTTEFFVADRDPIFFDAGRDEIYLLADRDAIYLSARS